jgi:membrane-associated phospholipid phosphatase
MTEARREPRRAVRRRSDVASAAGAAAILAACCAAIDGSRVSEFEERAFRAVNEISGTVYPALWPLMQFGTFIAIPVVVVVALVFRRVRLAVEAGAAGVSAYVLAKVVKGLFPRDRPGALLADVHLRGIGIGGRGYPSGHAAVSAALAYVVWPSLPRPWRWVVAILAAVVSLMRMYVGGHLPLDVLGGAALGVACGAVVTLIGGVIRAPGLQPRRRSPSSAAESDPGGVIWASPG